MSQMQRVSWFGNRGSSAKPLPGRVPGEAGHRRRLPSAAHANAGKDHGKAARLAPPPSQILGLQLSFLEGPEKPSPHNTPSRLPESPGHVARLQARGRIEQLVKSHLKTHKRKQVIRGGHTACR